MWLNINKTIIHSVSYEQQIRTLKVKATSFITVTHWHIYRHVLIKWLTMFLTVCVCVFYPNWSCCSWEWRLQTVSVWINKLQLFFPRSTLLYSFHSSHAVPSGNTCITAHCSSVQGALLDNSLLTPPPPSVAALSASPCRGWNGDITAAGRVELRLPAAARLYLRSDEVCVDRRRSCIKLAKQDWSTSSPGKKSKYLKNVE